MLLEQGRGALAACDSFHRPLLLAPHSWSQSKGAQHTALSILRCSIATEEILYFLSTIIQHWSCYTNALYHSYTFETMKQIMMYGGEALLKRLLSV